MSRKINRREQLATMMAKERPFKVKVGEYYFKGMICRRAKVCGQSISGYGWTNQQALRNLTKRLRNKKYSNFRFILTYHNWVKWVGSRKWNYGLPPKSLISTRVWLWRLYRDINAVLPTKPRKDIKVFKITGGRQIIVNVPKTAGGFVLRPQFRPPPSVPHEKKVDVHAFGYSPPGDEDFSYNLVDIVDPWEKDEPWAQGL